jgi:hypothetical protein
MKWIALKILAILAAASCVSCSHSKESSFFRSFSLRELVAENKSNVPLDCGAGGGGGGSGSRIGVWSLGSGSGEFHSHKGDGCYCKLEADAVGPFNEATLIAALAQDVERTITDSGAQIVDRGQKDSSSFYIGYVLEDTTGRVEISGKRLPSDHYSLQANLEESATVKSW